MDPPSSSRLSVSLHADVNSFHLANKHLAGRNITFQILVSICFHGFFHCFYIFVDIIHHWLRDIELGDGLSTVDMPGFMFSVHPTLP